MESQPQSCVRPQSTCLSPWARMWLHWLCGSLATMPCAVQVGNWSHTEARTFEMLATIKRRQEKKNTLFNKTDNKANYLTLPALWRKWSLPWELGTWYDRKFGAQICVPFRIQEIPSLEIKLKWVLIVNTWDILTAKHFLWRDTHSQFRFHVISKDWPQSAIYKHKDINHHEGKSAEK